ncbi:MAG: cytochrome c, partial [Candidatus Hydrogenedentota bacterium]
MNIRRNALMGIALAGTLSATSGTFAEPLTYTKDVAPILNKACVTCHRPGQVGPMSLMSYKEVRPWAKSIRKQVAERSMPPWHATESKVGFTNDRSLTDEEIATITEWIDTGVNRGKRSDMPKPTKFPKSGTWQLGDPDLVVNLPEVEVPGGGPDVFKNLPGIVNLKEEKWMTAIEILPSNTKVAHHVIAFQSRGFNPDPVGGWLGAWASGTDPMMFPKGTGRVMKTGHSIIGNMHYHPTETDEVDQTRIGLHFATKEDGIEKELTNMWVMNSGFKIPAGDANHEVISSMLFRQDGKIMAFAPHMHYRGKDFRYTATYPDGTQELLLSVDNYDFNWQTNYLLETPIDIPAGTTVECVAHFDNSVDNPVNPDPTRDITFGNESYDEMMIGFLDFIVDDGIRPMSREEYKAIVMDETIAMDADNTYSVYFRDPGRPTVIYLPKSGEGAFV